MEVVQNTRHHLSSCFPSIEKVQLIKAELKEHLTLNDLRTAIPKSSLWPHLKYPNNVLAFAFFSELLEHFVIRSGETVVTGTYHLELSRYYSKNPIVLKEKDVTRALPVKEIRVDRV